MVNRVGTNTLWQLEVFQLSLKKQEKVKTLLKFLGTVTGKKCLLITCGDNNGSMNYYFEKFGGEWSFADLESKNLHLIKQVVGPKIVQMDREYLCFKPSTFDVVIVIDVLEHIQNDLDFLKKLKEIMKRGAKVVVTVPNAGDMRLITNRIRKYIGMTPKKYGHIRGGYTEEELSCVMRSAGYWVKEKGGYSKFFTETIELFINFLYVFILNKEEGEIAPSFQSEKEKGLLLKFYQIIFPFLKFLSRLDKLLTYSGNYATVVVGYN